MFVVALSTGQRGDPAIVGAEVVDRQLNDRLTRFSDIRLIERIANRTVPAVTGRLRDIKRSPRLVGRLDLLVDAGPLGRSTLDELAREHVPAITVEVRATTRQHKPYGLLVGWEDLMSTLQYSFDSRRLTVSAKLPLYAELLEQLNRVTGDSFRTETPDMRTNLLTAAGIVAYHLERIRPAQLGRQRRRTEYNPLDHDLTS